MAIIVNDSIRANIAKPLEDKRMNNGVPYTDVEEANELLDAIVDRYESLEVVVGTPSAWSIYWYKDGVEDTDLVLKQEGGVGLSVWNNTTVYTKDIAVLYEAPSGYYTIYVAKQANIGVNPTTSTADWGVANDGAFIPINGNASVNDTKSFESIQIRDTLNFTSIESGVGIHYIVDTVNNILRLNRFPSATPLDIDNDIIRYFSALEEIAIRWKLKLESVSVGDNNDEVLLIGSDGEVKKISFSEISVETTDLPEQDSEQPFNAGGAYLLQEDIEQKVSKTGDTMTGDLIIEGDLDVEAIEINGGQVNNLSNATQPQQAATKNQLDTEITAVRADISSVYRAAGDWDASTGTFPTVGTGAAGVVRRGDTYNVIVAGTISGFEPLDIGDTFYANVNIPAQTASNWKKFESNTAQATESFRGTAKIATQAIIENESTLNETDIVTPSKFWMGWTRIKQLASTFAAKVTFTVSPRLSSTTANQYLKVDASKDITSVGTIPATDITEDSTHRFTTDTEKTTWNAKQNALTFDTTPTAASTNPVTSGGVKTALDLKSDLPNELISGGALSIVSVNTIRIASAIWRVVPNQYSTATNTDFPSIANSAAGLQRYIGFYGTTSNTITKVEGVEGTIAVMPDQPANTALLRVVLVNDSGIAVQQVSAGLATKLDRNLGNINGVPTGTGAAYVLTLSPPITGVPVNGQPILFMPQITNTGAATLNASGTAYPIVKSVNTPLVAGDILAGKDYILLFNTTNNTWQVLGELRNDTILNQTTAQTASFYVTGTGRVDAGLGVGTAPNAAARAAIGANTATISQLRLTPSATDVTSPVNGDIYVNGAEVKVMVGGIQNRFTKVYDNELFKSDGNYFLLANQYGDLSATVKAGELCIYNTTAISEIVNNSSWVDATKTITTGLVFKGQIYYSATTKYFYLCVDNDKMIRIPIRNNRSCTKTITIATTGASFQDNDLIGANEVHFLISNGALSQNGDGTYTFNSTTGTITMSVNSGDMITFTYT